MANGEFIELLSPSALKDLTTANAELLTMVANVDKINQKMKGISTPSGSDGAIKQLTAEYQKQEETVRKLQIQIKKLAETKANNNQKTQEEITNGRILASNANRQTLATSALAGAYRNLSAQVAIASEKYQNLIARGKTAEQTQRQFNRELRTAQKEFQVLQTKVLQADNAVGKWSRTNQRSIGFAKDLMGAFGIVGGVTAFALITKDIFEQTKEIMSLNNALKLVTETQENYFAQQSFIARISEAYGASINDLTKQFTQFYVSAKDKISSTEIQGIFESITKAGASMGLSVQSQERAFLALNQMMSKGTIQAEELRGQLGEALPGAFGIMAKAVGVTEKELAKMMKAGDLIASDVLPKFAKQLEITYGIENIKRVENLASAQNRLSNAWRNFVASLDEDGNRLSAFFSTLLNEATKTLKAWQTIFSSTETLRKKELDSMQASGEALAKKNLASISDADQRKQYAKDRIEELNQEKIVLRDTALELEKKNKLIKETQTKTYNKGTFGETTRITGSGAKEIKENQQAIARANDQYKKAQGLIIGYATALEVKNQKAVEETKLTKDQIKAEQDRLKALEELRKNEFDREISDLQRRKKLQQDIFDDEEAYLADRVKASEDIANTENMILLKQYAENLRIHKDSLDLQAIDANEYVTAYENSIKNSEERILKIKKDNYKAYLEYIEKNGMPADEEKFGLGTRFAPSDELDKMVEGYKKLNKEKAESKKLTKEEEQAISDYLKSFQQEFLGNAGIPTLFAIMNDEIVGFGTNWGVTMTTIMELTQEAMNVIAEAGTQRHLNYIRELEEERNIALAFAGDNVAGQEEINRQFEERKKQAELKEFERKKKLAKANVLIDTAQAIISLYAENNWVTATVLAGILTGVSLYQMSQIDAQQPPAYEHGTDNHKGGLMKINDQKGSNYKEIVQTPDGKMRMFNERNKILNAPKGTKVFTASESALMFDNGLNNMLLNNGISMPKIEVNNNSTLTDTQVKAIVGAIQSKETTNINIDKSGLNTYVRDGHTTKQIMNNRVRGIGKKV